MGNVFEIVRFRNFSSSHYVPVPIKIVKTLKWREGDYLKIQVVDGKLIVEKLEV